MCRLDNPSWFTVLLLFFFSLKTSGVLRDKGRIQRNQIRGVIFKKRKMLHAFFKEKTKLSIKLFHEEKSNKPPSHCLFYRSFSLCVFVCMCLVIFFFFTPPKAAVFVFVLFFLIMSSEQCMYPLICQMSFIM